MHGDISEQDINVIVTTGLLLDISDPVCGDRGEALGPLNLRRGRRKGSTLTRLLSKVILQLAFKSFDLEFYRRFLPR